MALDVHWAEFAWELQQAKSIPAIRKALIPLKGIAALDLFTLPASRKGTWKELRDLRRERHSLNVRIRDAVKEEKQRRESLEHVTSALSQTSPRDTEKLQQICGQREKALARANDELAELSESAQQVEDAILRQEAWIAQSELLDLLQSERYKINPKSLANALAGVPFMRWRQSIARSQRLTAGRGTMSHFRLFQRVARALANPPATATAATEQAKSYLLRAGRRQDLAIKELRAQFYYLRLAIETVYPRRPPKGALPYNLVAEYRRRAASPTRLDQVFEQEERLFPLDAQS